MKTTGEYISILRRAKSVLQRDYGVRSLCLFGSVARGQQTEHSDVDVCVEMQPDPLRRASMKRYLQSLLGCDVDVVRRHPRMDTFLMEQINHDAVYAF